MENTITEKLFPATICTTNLPSFTNEILELSKMGSVQPPQILEENPSLLPTVRKIIDNYLKESKITPQQKLDIKFHGYDPSYVPNYNNLITSLVFIKLPHDIEVTFENPSHLDNYYFKTESNKHTKTFTEGDVTVFGKDIEFELIVGESAILVIEILPK